jgi:hypothetical protein
MRRTVCAVRHAMQEGSLIGFVAFYTALAIVDVFLMVRN